MLSVKKGPAQRLMNRLAPDDCSGWGDPPQRWEQLLGDGCWPWPKLDSRGYGLFSMNGRRYGAHTAVWVLAFGPVPFGMEIDHLCHTWAVEAGTCKGGGSCLHRRCCRLSHLEPVTHAENIRRGMTGKCKHSRGWLPSVTRVATFGGRD
jgi:hypothetical protein